MQIIIAPIQTGDSSASVLNLHDVLLLMIDKNIIWPLDAPKRPSAEELQGLLDKLQAERKKSVYGETTQIVVRLFQIKQGLAVATTGEVDEVTADRLNQHLKALGVLDGDAYTFVVHGSVRDNHGKPQAKRIVRAFDKDLRKEQLLGESITDRQGVYEIKYSAEKFSEADNATAPDLIVRVFNDDGKTLVESAIVFNAGQDETVDLVLLGVGARLSEYERLVQKILPLLIGQGEQNEDLSIDQLKRSDSHFLAKDTSEPIENIEFFIAAVQLTHDANAEGIPDSAFFGWLRKAQPNNLPDLQKQSPSTLRTSLLEAIEEAIVPAALKEKIDHYIDLLANPQWQELKDFVQVLGLKPEEQLLLSQHFDHIDAINDTALLGLVQAEVLSDSQADRLGLAASMQALIQGPISKLGILLDTTPPVLGRALVRSEDLARLHPEDWQNMIKAADITPAAGESIEEFSEALEEVAVNAYPTVGLLYRSARTPVLLEGHFQLIQPQTDALKKIWSLSTHDPELVKLVDTLPEEQQQAVSEIQKFVRSHPGMDADLPFGKLQEASRVWVGQLSELIKANEDQDLLAMDYSVLADKPVELDFGNLPHEPVLRELKGLQRVLAVAENPGTVQVLMRAGLHSATQIALHDRKTLMEKTGLDDTEVEILHIQALEQSGQVATAYFAVHDAAQTQNMLTGAADIGQIPQLDVLRKLFGNLDACECAHCLSVLSPAAYFVDMMYYIERFISPPAEANRALKARRPDLWELPLSCDNTHTIVPSLDIVNRVLETWLKQKLNLNSSVDLFNEIATLSASRFNSGFNPSFSLPTNFPLLRLEILLAHFGLSLDRVAQALGWTPVDRVRTRLQLTFDEVSLITQPKTTDLIAATKYFESLYKIPINYLHQTNADALSVGNFYDLSQLQHQTKINRDVLRNLVLSQFVSSDGSTNPPVVVVLVASAGAVQNDIEKIRNLSVRRLDRLHRLLRLWRTLPWTVAELDYVLKRLAVQRSLVPAEITTDVLDDIVSLLDLADRTRLPVDELMSLFGALPDVGLRGDESLFNRRFNTQPFVVRDGVWPAALPAQLKHPAFSPNEGFSTPDKNTLARLLAALKIDNSQFLELVNGLANAQVAGIETLKKEVRRVAGEAQYEIRLTSVSLLLLYRHALLARLLGVKVSILLRLMALTPELNSKPTNKQFVETMPDLLALLKFYDAQKNSGYSLEQVDWLLNPARAPADTKPAAKIALSVVQIVAKERRLVISSKTLTAAGLTELESTQAIKKLNETILETFGSTDEYRLRSEIAMSDIQPQVFSKLSASLDFDIAESAILSLAKHLGEFEDTAFSTPLYIDDATSKQTVTDNLVSITKPKNAFIKIRDEDLTTTPVQRARYRINPAFDQKFPAIRLQNLAAGLADKMVRESLKAMYATGSAKVLPETLFQKIFLSEQQSRWLAAANTGDSSTSLLPLMPSASADGLLLNPNFFAAVTAPSLVLTKLVTTPISVLLARYHWQLVFDEVLASELAITAGRVTEFRSYDFPANTTAITRALQGLTTDMSPLTQWIAQAQRLQCLLHNPIFDVAACHQVLSTWPMVAAQTARPILWNHILSASACARWLKVAGDNTPAAISRRVAIERLLRRPAGQDLSEQDVVDVLAISIDEIKSARPITPARTEWHQQLDQWALILGITARLGVSGETINRMRPKTVSKTVGTNTIVVEDVDSLWRAADDIHAAFRAKYFDVAVFNEKSEAFEDLTRGKRRDALVAFLVSEYAFQGPSQLYAHFLLDVEVSGCARTSELVSATMSLQLYVHRVLVGLELSDQSTKVHYTSEDARKEWTWRKHYRVWEANRKVFLYPENFIEPDLRDDKTPLFHDLENELLQRQITTAEAEESYAKYLTGYGELAGLKIVGAFHDMETDILHLVGVTESDPPIHYLRQVNNMANSGSDAKKPLQFGPWEKLNAQIPVKWVSPVIYQRKLMLFWNEITTVPSDRKTNDKRYFDGYTHKFKVKWIERKSDKNWTAHQALIFTDTGLNVKQSVNDKLVFLRGPDPDPEYPSQLPSKVTENSSEKFLGSPLYDLFLYLLDKKPSSEISFSAPYKAIPEFQKYSDYSTIVQHSSAVEGYTLSNWNWERVFPTVRYVGTGDAITETLQIAAMDHSSHGFMLNNERRISYIPYEDIEAGRNNNLAAHWMFSFFRNGSQLRTSGSNAIGPVGHHVWYSTDYLLSEKTSGALVTQFNANISDGLAVNSRAYATLPSNNVNAYLASAILHAGAFQVLAINGAQPRLITLSSSLAQAISMQLAAQSIPGVLNLAFEKTLNEAEPLSDQSIAARFSSGAFGTYLRETFFHIPFLIANHLNSQQRFAEAQQWYHYIFNPMNSAKPWQYREFDGLAMKSMREMLTDPVALAAYRNDPFNPHAIARTRLSAYQKSIAMKYIDNLLDWGDKLFSQFTMESVNEATMLYVLASDILGQRPAQLPRCADETPRTYAQIKPRLSEVSDFLIEEIEQITIKPSTQKSTLKTIKLSNNSMKLKQSPAGATGSASYAATADGTGNYGGGAAGAPIYGNYGGGVGGGNSGYGAYGGGTVWTSTAGTSLTGLQLGNKELHAELNTVGSLSARLIGGNIDYVPGGTPVIAALFSKEPEINISGLNLTGGKVGLLDIKYTLNDVPPPHRDVIRDQPPKFEVTELVSARSVFCFPQNEELLAYWNRVEDRLFKVRNCMDIAGVRRRLDLFAPEIDPRLLVRMKAAGLSLDDVLDVTTGHAPPYRFAFLLEKARQYAGTVQSLASQMLSALEKRDAEELAAMRSVHEQQLLEMRTQLMRWEIDASNDALEGLNKQREAAEYRKEHYEGLISGGLSTSELAQEAASILALQMGAAVPIAQIAAAVLSAFPQIHVGPLPSTETGGASLSTVVSLGANAAQSLASLVSQAGQAAGTHGGYLRREEEWQHQSQLAAHELKQINKQIEAAEIRVLISERSLELHEKSIEQAREVYDFYRNKFSNLGLYTWMSTQLNRMHRLAFNTAWSMARMAEKALHFERPDLRDSVNLGATAWDVGRAGLLAGESLLLELQRMEMRHLETNYRELEVEQAFSLAQFGADKLMELQTTGECEFSIPEFFFDLHYPGQYRRRIKAVRLTLPCVIGPYGSIGATLTMTRSELRDRPQVNAPLKIVPLRQAPIIAASNAQNDAGVFEFSFRDERYMPFEGMGAISSWKLSLPKTARSLDYSTISDVILRVNYTALENSELRDAMEINNDELMKRLQDAAPVKVFSLRHDFPTEWAQFKTAQANTAQRCELRLSLKPEHFPFWAAPFLGHSATESTIFIDSVGTPSIMLYKSSSPPGNPAIEVKDTAVKVPGTGEKYHSGSLTEVGPVTTQGDWVVYFDVTDRNQIKDVWLSIKW